MSERGVTGHLRQVEAEREELERRIEHQLRTIGDLEQGVSTLTR